MFVLESLISTDPYVSFTFFRRLSPHLLSYRINCLLEQFLRSIIMILGYSRLAHTHLEWQWPNFEQRKKIKVFNYLVVLNSGCCWIRFIQCFSQLLHKLFKEESPFIGLTVKRREEDI